MSAPNLLSCDVPGTQGKVTLGSFADGTPTALLKTFHIMRSGNTDHYTPRDGPSISGLHFVANDLLSIPDCNGAMDLGSTAAGQADTLIALNCNSQSGNNVAALFDFVVNGQQVACAILEDGIPLNSVGDTPFTLFAGPQLSHE
ncbi:hypothetical protein DFH08DRAFT_813169 [Mycena albidolilacea]|uniref:Uncharacterized protein n=1 Tax=Mycena albidolilacea TaxID=1033008 RepID=A0AAD6ZSA6_9AGAR|nr:hypothetical protein DFH08DRAFT_813169 [Mycena albidolilacea]